MIGGTGTISYDSTLYFLQKGHNVYLLNRGNRNDLVSDQLHYIVGDAYNHELMKEILKGEKFDVIIDFLIYDINEMQERLKIYNNKCRQFIFISSATVYQLTSEKINENSTLGNDEWEYSRSKQKCEEYLKTHYKEYSFYYTIIRPYITYDNRRLPFPVISKASYYSLIDRVLHNKPIIICGDGNNKLTLTHTKDFAVALEGILLNPIAQNEDFHITSDFVVSWNDILDILEGKLNRQIEAIYIPTKKLAEYFPTERDELLYDKSQDHIFDNEKICNAVPAFKTTLDVKTGLEHTVEYLMTEKSLQKIDKVWNYTEDAVIERYEKECGTLKHKASCWSKYMYQLYQYSDHVILKKIFNRIRRYRGAI